MKVKVVAGNRGKFVLRWVDSGGTTRQRTLDLQSKPANRSKAYKLAAELESELSGDSEPNLLLPKRQRAEESMPKAPGVFGIKDGEWEAYKQHFIDTHLTSLSENYQKTMIPILNRFESFANPDNVRDVGSQTVRTWLAKLRDEGLAPSSIKTYWRHLSAFLSMAETDGLRDSVPKVRLPKVGRKMKGRPLIGEELDRLKSAVEKERSEDQWADWKWAIEGLWLSGLRISEAYKVTWHPTDFYIEMNEGHPAYIILGDQKSGKHERLPIVPDFAEVLHQVPKSRRHGNVFSFPGNTASGQVSFTQAKKVISALGNAAGIKTSQGKTASAHDFRRSFGTRWAMKVMPQILQKLMRHAEIKTTMTFYAHLDADSILESILGDQTGDQKSILPESGRRRKGI